jgi:enamine deaminase RidA (YjgF/YER057c/UK114 family)
MSLEYVTNGLPKPVFPYTPAVKVPTTGRHLYLSGQLGVDEEAGILVGDDIVSQTKQVSKHICLVIC